MDWSALNPMDPEASAKELSELAQTMAGKLEENPPTGDRLMEMFAHSLDGPITPDTYSALWEGITNLFGVGNDAPQLFSWLIQTDQNDRLEPLVAQSPAVFGQLLRESVAMYGPRLRQAYRRWHELPDNWELMLRENYFDIDRGGHRINVAIYKFNGETVKLALDARSLLLMVARLLGSLSLVAAGPFTDDELDELRRESDAFWQAIEATRVGADGEPQKGSEGA